jgi:carboxypeptidase C (cathepsin A)
MITALHVNNVTWLDCNNYINENYRLQSEGSIWIYPILKANNIKILFYSGDTDGIVPLAGTRKWIKYLNWKTVEEWRPWKSNNHVAGFIQHYEGLDFATVKGVGHMAPQWSRQAN